MIAKTYKFNNCGATGQAGPSQAQANTAYAGTGYNVTVTNGYQSFTISDTGLYRITVAGASGGVYNQAHGRGRIVKSDFMLTQGDVIHMAVGQMGVYYNASYGGGGGGGTFVVKADPSSNNILTSVGNAKVTSLIIAGGGGGQYNSGISTNSDASLGTSGNDGDAYGTGGTNGNGGNGNSYSYSGSGGGGFLGNGGYGVGGDSYSSPGKSFLSTALGGVSPSYSANGGFGGGGACYGRASSSYYGGGGGGGYSGGGGGGRYSASSGGGGGSYSSQPITDLGFNTGHGYVIMEFITPGPIAAKVNDEWKSTEVFGYKNDAWRKIAQTWTRISGIWKEVYGRFAKTLWSNAISLYGLNNPTNSNRINALAILDNKDILVLLNSNITRQLTNGYALVKLNASSGTISKFQSNEINQTIAPTNTGSTKILIDSVTKMIYIFCKSAVYKYNQSGSPLWSWAQTNRSDYGDEGVVCQNSTHIFLRAKTVSGLYYILKMEKVNGGSASLGFNSGEYINAITCTETHLYVIMSKNNRKYIRKYTKDLVYVSEKIDYDYINNVNVGFCSRTDPIIFGMTNDGTYIYYNEFYFNQPTNNKMIINKLDSSLNLISSKDIIIGDKECNSNNLMYSNGYIYSQGNLRISVSDMNVETLNSWWPGSSGTSNHNEVVFDCNEDMYVVANTLSYNGGAYNYTTGCQVQKYINYILKGE